MFAFAGCGVWLAVDGFTSSQPAEVIAGILLAAIVATARDQRHDSALVRSGAILTA
jgi:hypothetical protein